MTKEKSETSRPPVPETPIPTEQVNETPAQAAPALVLSEAQTKNFHALRVDKERIEKERNILKQQLQEIEASKKKATAEQEFKLEEIQLAPDDLAEGKHISQVTKKIKHLEKQIQEYQKETNVVSVESRLRSQYTDFADVVSEANIATLKQSYPEIAKTLSLSTDMYSTAVSAYTLIKKFGIHKDTEVAPKDPYHLDKDRVHKNMAKPRPLTSISPQEGDSPLTKANAFAGGFTPELRKATWQKMQEIKKNS